MRSSFVTDNSNAWDWQGQGYSIGDNSDTEMSKFFLSGGSENGDYQSYMLDDTTPIKACGNLTHHSTNNGVVNGKDLEHFSEPSSQVKRRRMLQFETEVMDAPLCNDEMFLRSEETSDSLEDAIDEMSKWVAVADDTAASGNECLDPSAEVWISDCFIDPNSQFTTPDIASGESDAQVEVAEICDIPPQHNANPVHKLPVHTHQNVALRGTKSNMHTPPKLASSVIYPFTFIKPCGAHGVMTLKDINRRILTPPSPKQDDEDLNGSLQTSPFSGKPVVGKTRIRTEGGEGSITILRTKG